VSGLSTAAKICQMPGDAIKRKNVGRSGQWTPHKSYALRESRFGQSSDNNRSNSGMPNPGPWQAISVPKLYRPPLSQRKQATARTAVWAAT
jgi:hypothetical protein